jgi:hypothetical protein
MTESPQPRRRTWAALIFSIPIGLAITAAGASAQSLVPKVPGAAEFAGIVTDMNWAEVLGKALFFDEQVGSNGIACASCHVHAGADSRLVNQMSPGLKDITASPDGDFKFGSERADTGEVLPGFMASGDKSGPNYTLQPEDMPFHQLADGRNRNSEIKTTTNDRVSSASQLEVAFKRVRRERNPDDKCKEFADDRGRGVHRPLRQVLHPERRRFFSTWRCRPGSGTRRAAIRTNMGSSTSLERVA